MHEPVGDDDRRMETSLDDLDQNRLERLRARFLEDSPEPRAMADYWSCDEDLVAYDAVFAARIGWKWDAVFDELEARNIRFDAAGTILDFGCGTGIATRRFLRRAGVTPARVLLHDRSARAMGFAAQRVAEQNPAGLDVQQCESVPDDAEFDVVLVSHVLGELSKRAERDLVNIVERSRVVIWVEPGSRVISRRLSAIRDGFLDDFDVLAPCTHARSCCALSEGDRDWCHFFATPPGDVFTDSGWVKIGRQLGIDLRSLPYAFLMLRAKSANEPVERDPAEARILGRPTVRPKFARFFACDAEGLRQVTVFKSESTEAFKRFKKGKESVWTWVVAE